MVKDKMVMNALLCLIQGKVIQIGDGKSNLGFIYEVDNQTVRIYPKKGRRIIECSCLNQTKHINEQNTLCKHKISAILEFVRLTNGNKKI